MDLVNKHRLMRKTTLFTSPPKVLLHVPKTAQTLHASICEPHEYLQKIKIVGRMVPIQSIKKSESKYSSNETELLKLSWICCNFHPSGFLINLLTFFLLIM